MTSYDAISIEQIIDEYASKADAPRLRSELKALCGKSDRKAMICEHRPESRRKMLTMGVGFLPMLFREGETHYRVVEDPLPPDARVVNVRLSFDGQSVEFMLESEHFPPVEDGLVCPTVNPVMATIYDDAPRKTS